MTYGHSDRASAASAAAVQRALARAEGTWGGYRAFRPAATQPSVAVAQAPKPAPEPAPKPAPNPANDATLAGQLCEHLEGKKGYIGYGS